MSPDDDGNDVHQSLHTQNIPLHQMNEFINRDGNRVENTKH